MYVFGAENLILELSNEFYSIAHANKKLAQKRSDKESIAAD